MWVLPKELERKKRRSKKVVGKSVSKNQPCDVIKMREVRGEVGKRTPKKEMNNPSFV